MDGDLERQVSGTKDMVPQAWASLLAQLVKNLPAVQETWVPSLGWEDPLEKGIATLSSILAWRIPWTEEPGYSPQAWAGILAAHRQPGSPEPLLETMPPLPVKRSTFPLQVLHPLHQGCPQSAALTVLSLHQSHPYSNPRPRTRVLSCKAPPFVPPPPTHCRAQCPGHSTK